MVCIHLGFQMWELGLQNVVKLALVTIARFGSSLAKISSAVQNACTHSASVVSCQVSCA